ncbi:DUF2182 domain-containing protein [Nitrospina gracilis]|nr:DUF2182 domain-containing protein [Nitrospina gracilis]
MRALETVFKHDRWLVAAGLLAIALLSWWYLASMAADMGSMSMLQPEPAHQRAHVVWLFWMWAVMMVAMMTPSAAPMVLTFSAIHRKQGDSSKTALATLLFVSGYLLVWTVFSLGAALLQWGLHGAAWVSPMMASQSHLLSAVLLFLAGVYQWLPVKEVCLRHCRSPLDFFLLQWKTGSFGAFSMGWYHGLYCVGCCWLLMLLLFVNGVMNLLWVGVLAVFVLIEKVVPLGMWWSRVTGLLLVAWALLLVVQ